VIVGARTFVIALTGLLAACDNATGEDYKFSLPAKHVYSVLQVEEQRLHELPGKAYVYKAQDPDLDVDTVAFPAKDGSGYVVFTAEAREGRVLSVPEDRSITADIAVVRDLQKKGLISDPVVAELVRRSS
jgi:hypothetical protein